MKTREHLEEDEMDEPDEDFRPAEPKQVIPGSHGLHFDYRAWFV